jgi:DNA-binding GntR family transcriptional regulator
MELAKLERQRAVDAVYKTIRQGILTGLFKPGERLDIPEIAEKLGVSLTPVRHALQMLAAEGLIENRPRIGTFVQGLSVRDIEENFEIRCALECLAAETVVQHITSRQLARLRELLRMLGEPVETPEARKLHEAANAELHRTLVKDSGNGLLSDLYDRLQSHLIIARLHNANSNLMPRWHQERAEHEAIVAALEQRDPAKLKKVLRDHIHRGKEALMSDLKKSVAGRSEPPER